MAIQMTRPCRAMRICDPFGAQAVPPGKEQSAIIAAA